MKLSILTGPPRWLRSRTRIRSVRTVCVTKFSAYGLHLFMVRTETCVDCFHWLPPRRRKVCELILPRLPYLGDGRTTGKSLPHHGCRSLSIFRFRELWSSPLPLDQHTCRRNKLKDAVCGMTSTAASHGSFAAQKARWRSPGPTQKKEVSLSTTLIEDYCNGRLRHRAHTCGFLRYDGAVLTKAVNFHSIS
jgi:hypothetical protein